LLVFEGDFGMKTVCRIAAFAAFFAGSAASAQQLAPSPTLDAVKKTVRGIKPSIAWYDFRKVWIQP